MTEKFENYEHLTPIPFGYGCAWILGSVGFFQLLNLCVKQANTDTTTPSEELWKWRNLLISWIHALIVGTWVLSSFFFYPELMTDLIAFQNMYIYALVAFSTGYFFHDFIDIVVSGQLGKMWEVIPHHIAVAGMFFYNVVQCRCIAYNIVALLAEVNTIFLHSRKLLQMLKISFSHWLYQLNASMNLFTFVSCRFLGLAWIIYGMFIWGERVSRVYFVVLASAMFVMWVTNMLLFWRLIYSDLIRPFRQWLHPKMVDSKKEKLLVHSNGNGLNGVVTKRR